ncbi:MAG: S8 family peptidase [Chloroflexi bacterium]|nr:S8 family peptidase [Chloroflexota bacterium]
MKRFASLFTAGLFMASALLTPEVFGQPTTAALAPLTRATSKAVPNQYIVVLKDGPSINAGSVASDVGATPKHVYSAAVNGFAAELNQGQLNALRRNPQVAYIEQDQVVKADVTQPMDANGDPWGLDRIDQRNLPLSGSFTYYRTGAGVHAYIIDTGIAPHTDFGSSLSSVGYTAILDGNGLNDCNGHGTHVAGMVGGTVYGVAKDVTLHPVRVLDCNGSGTTAGVIAGVDYVRLNAVKPAVANMSLGGGSSTALNTAVANLISSGVFTAVAAGNSNVDACSFSPASVATAYTTAASTKTDAKASYSNWGTCVDGYAPGSAIKSAWLANGTNTINGTSMASPHVAGCAAQYLQANPSVTPAQVTSWINASATPNKITGNPPSTPNRLLYCLAGDVWARDNVGDTGVEPNPASSIWHSPDIWNRHAADAGLTHQPPQFGLNYAYANVRNRALGPDTGTLEFYAFKSGTGPAWPDWLLIGSVSLTIQAGEVRTVAMPWNITQAGHYCIQVRWISSTDPMAYTGPDGTLRIRNNNNIAQRNMEDVYPSIGSPVGVDLDVVNPGPVLAPQRLAFREPQEQLQDPFVRRGRLTIDLGREVTDRWLQGGGKGQGFQRVGETRFVLTDPAGAVFDGVMLEPGKYFPIKLSFEALTTSTTGKPFIIDAEQSNAEGVAIGGVRYNVYLPKQ